MPRRIERVERERLVRPAREEIDQPTALEQVSDAEGKHLRDAGAREARLQHRSDVGEQKRALCIDRGDLTPALQLPLERATGGTAEVYAGMTFDIGRPLGYSVSVRRYTGAETVRTRVSRNSRLIMDDERLGPKRTAMSTPSTRSPILSSVRSSNYRSG